MPVGEPRCTSTTTDGTALPPLLKTGTDRLLVLRALTGTVPPRPLGAPVTKPGETSARSAPSLSRSSVMASLPPASALWSRPSAKRGPMLVNAQPVGFCE